VMATFRQKTKVYLGLSDESDQRAIQSLSVRRRLIGGLVALALGLILCFWSLSWGLTVIAALVLSMCTPVIRRYRGSQTPRE
jgi:hypothetical protein